MESIPDRDTPLAAFLEGEGTYDGTGDAGIDISHAARASDHVSLRARIRNRLTAGGLGWARKGAPHGTAKGNAFFLEQFRYVVVASQLVDEHLEFGSVPAATRPDVSLNLTSDPATITLIGTVSTAAMAFASVLLIRLVRDAQNGAGRLLVLVLCAAMVALLAHVYIRTHRLQVLQDLALAQAVSMVHHLQQFERASSATLSLIQEVELVAKGYRISAPLPPITRLDNARATRRCGSLRRQLRAALVKDIDNFIRAIHSLSSQFRNDDLDKYLDIYDMAPQACVEALSPLRTDLVEDQDSLHSLRLMLYKRNILRRYFLCCLLALEAPGDASDIVRWHFVSEQMRTVTHSVAAHVFNLQSALQDLSEFVTPPSPKPAPGHTSERLRNQLRQIGTLSQGIRSLHAKMALMREESAKAIDDSDDLTDLGPVLMNQYETIGTELHSLLSDWEAGKAALSDDIERHERCVSLASAPLGLLSPTMTGSTAVSDHELSSGGPADALHALTAQTDSNSDTSNNDQEQVYEALAVPRKRASINLVSRAERISRANEERSRLACEREKRASGASVIRELQSVINLRRTSMPATKTNSRPSSRDETDDADQGRENGAATDNKGRRTSSVTVRPPIGFGLRVVPAGMSA